jgi:hypothetical protein
MVVRRDGLQGGRIMGALVEKPLKLTRPVSCLGKGMHWRTFERAMERVNEAEEIVDAHLALPIARMLRRSL